MVLDNNYQVFHGLNKGLRVLICHNLFILLASLKCRYAECLTLPLNHQDEAAEVAKNAGASIVGGEELIKKVLQSAKKASFTACFPGKLKLALLAQTSLVSLAPKTFLMGRIDFAIPSSKKFTGPSGLLKTKFSSPIAKSTRHGLSDTTFFACCTLMNILAELIDW